MSSPVPISAARRRRWRVLCALVAAGAASASAFESNAHAQANHNSNPRGADVTVSPDAKAKGSSLAVPRHVIAGGGGRSVGAVFAIAGTIGQADADPLQPSTGGEFAIAGGFWPGIVATESPGDAVFDDSFEPGLP